MLVSYRRARPQQVVYVRGLGPYAVSGPDAWARIAAWLEDQSRRGAVSGAIGLLRDNPAETGPYLRRYDACIPLAPGIAPDSLRGIGRQTLAGGAFAVYRHSGSYAEIPQLFSRLHREGVPQAGLALDPSRAFREVYGAGPTGSVAGERTTELWVPVLALPAHGDLSRILQAA